MAICVISNNGVLEASSTAIGSCTDYVMYTAQEYAALSPVFTPIEVTEIAFMVVGVWALAWGIKVLRRAL